MPGQVKRVGLLTGGGDCPGLNAVIRAVSKSLLRNHEIEVLGLVDGFQGLMDKNVRALDWDAVSGILQQGGTVLGTSNKANPFQRPVQKNGKTVYEDYSEQTLKNAEEMGLDAVVCIGGDGTMTVAHDMMKKGLRVVGVPKTIDNDIYGTDVTFGYDTALSTATDAIDRIHTTAMSHHRVMLVEVMGRYAGWLTLGSGLAGGADIVLIPEIEYDLEEICDVVRERSHRGRKFSIIAVAEGAKPQGGELTVARTVKDSPEKIRLGGIAWKLSTEIEDETGLECRATVLGHLQRGGTPTAHDRILATLYGVAAAELIANRQFDRMVALQNNKITSVPIKEIGGKTRFVDKDNRLIKAVLSVGSSLGTREL
ncbi:MAG: ATP-dependent 6-phosphofructokinase [candidate division KSB1 bacterium]|nr:ATP-dependent 6-phosphofructokinase [candidate division KSB1 bacterium]